MKNINLVANRTGDLLRAKFFCSQEEFMKILMIMKELDKYCRMKKSNFFKIVKVNNKIKTDNNNVLINYMFYDKIQCELQLLLNITDSP
jgi:hypothetical protein